MIDRKEMEAAFWNKIADIYDKTVERYYDKPYRRFRKIFFKYVKRTQKVLDVATGSGDIAFILAKRSKDVIGIDIAQSMIGLASSRSSGNPQFLIDDACELDYQRGTFDLVTCCNGLLVMKDPAKALKEMRRVLKSRSKIVTITFAYGEASFGERFQLFKQAIRIGRPSYWHSFKGKQVRVLHSEAGFKVLKCEFCWTSPPAVLTVARR